MSYFDEAYSWSLGTCSSNTEEAVWCCLDAGVYTLKCKNEEGYAWYEGFITIQGNNYCENWYEDQYYEDNWDGYEESIQVTIVTGKYMFI